MQTEILDQFDVERAKVAAERLRSKSARTKGWAVWNSLVMVVIALIVGRFALAIYASNIGEQALKAHEGVLYHEELRLRLKAIWYVRIALWPFLFEKERAAYATSLASIARTYYDLGDLPHAIAFESEAERFAESAGDNEFLANIRVTKANLILEVDPDGAKQAYLSALRLYEQERDLSADPSIHIRLADCALVARDFAGALAEVDKAATIAPNDYDVALKKVEVLTKVGREADALAIFDPKLLPLIGRPALPEPRYNEARYDPNFALGAKVSDAYPRFGADLALRLGLVDTLLAPALSRIAPGRRLIIVPDGVLWTLPFGILPTARGTKRVSDEWSITYSPSLAIMALNRLTSAPQPSKPFFGLGDVAFGSDSAGATGGRLPLRGIYIDRPQYLFPPLPETRREVEQAAQRFGVKAVPPDVLFGDDATETRFRHTALVDYRILHLATHGVANHDLANVGEPALLLAKDVENDGLLRASEVTSLSLGASVVVLAACKTGLGEDLGGEGVMSIARAFQHAGARTVVISLWNVPSEESEILFEAFYRELQSGKGAADSLRAAQRHVRLHYPEVFYWGAFTVIGERQ